MAKIKLHNPELAANSKFSNLVIESLTNDPTLTGTTAVGRLWFNNTDKTFKGAFLDEAGTATDIRPIGIDNSSQVDTISDELTATQAAAGLNTDGTYTVDATTNYIATATDLANADKLIDTQIKTNADAIGSLEEVVGSNIGDLNTLTTEAKDTLVNAIIEVDGNVDTNTGAISTLQGEVDTTQTGAGLNTDGTYTADATTTYITTATDLANADKLIDTEVASQDGRIDTIELAASNADADLLLLTTENKDSLKDAINEVDANTDTNTQAITDLTTDLTTDYLNKTTATAQVVTADTTFSSNLVIDGNLTVSGSTTTIETETLLVADNKITLNNGIGAIDPTENAGLEVDRGNEGVDTILNWNETLDQVEVLEDDVLRKVATTNYVDGEISTLSGTAGDTQTELDDTQTGAGLNTDGTYTADTTTNYITTATNLANADKLLDTQIKVNADAVVTEAGLRVDADDALDGRIDTLEANVGGATGDLANLTTDAQDNLVNAINEVDGHADTNASDIATEISARATAVGNVQGELDDTQTGAGLGVDGSYTADTLTNYITTATDLANADKLLDGQIKVNTDEITAVGGRVTTLEGTVTGNIGDLANLTTEAKDTLVNAINEVDANIDTEVSTRGTEITRVEGLVTTEAGTRGDADTALDTRIDNVNTAAGITGDGYTADATTNYLTGATDLMNADKVLDTTIKTNLDNLAATTATNGTTLVGYEGYVEADSNIVNPTIEIVAGNLKDSLDDIASSVNAKIHEIENRYVKGEIAEADKADTYTIAHNLDTEFVDVSVQVYDTDELVWRFDLVVVEVIDINTVKISLASGTQEQIRYVVQGY